MPRFFGWMTLEETADVLKVSIDRVWHDCDPAKLQHYREMSHRANL